MLPDINVWLALTFASHVHHATAKAWFDGLATDSHSYFCRLTQQGFLRLASNVKVFGNEALTLPDAWRVFDALANDPKVGFAVEPGNLENQWRILTQGREHSTNVWSDAYLAAFAISAGLTIITFDKGFAKFAGLSVNILD